MCQCLIYPTPPWPQDIIAVDGILGLMGRGLKTRLLANALQSVSFTVMWRLGQDAWARKFSSGTENPA